MAKKIKQRTKDPHFEVKTNNNSSMAQDLDEIQKLGKEMEQTKTETELQEENQTQDPKQ
jgi:hypothetical protein